MAKASDRAVAVTTLRVAGVEMPVALFSAHADARKLTKFDTAGPNGGVLTAVPNARVKVTEEPVEEGGGDPLGDVPATHMSAGAARPPKAEEGEYRRELVEAGSGELVLPDDVRRGVRLEDGRFVDCTDSLAAIVERTKLDRMDVVAFVDISKVPRARVKGCYYLGIPEAGDPALGLRLLLDALKRRRRCAIVKVTKRSRQSLGAIGWLGEDLMLYELVFSEDFREPPARVKAIRRVEAPEKRVALMCRLVDALAGTPELIDELRDDALELRERLHAAAISGAELSDVVTPLEEGEDVDLTAALEASVEAVA